MQNMKSFCKFISIIAVVCLFASSCDDEYGPRKESAPVIGSAAVTPVSFSFGDSVTLTASVSDPATSLTSLAYEIVVDNKTIGSGSIPIGSQEYNVSERIFIPLVSNQSDNAQVTINITASNILKGTSSGSITGLTGKRARYDRLYLVTDDGLVVTLTPQTSNPDKYEAAGLTLPGSFNYWIAEKVRGEQVDDDGLVWGNVNGRISLVDSRGGPAFACTPGSDYTRDLVYDNFTFDLILSGSTFGTNDIVLDVFGEATIGEELYRTLARTMEKGQEYTLFGKLADEQIIYNPDFFERISSDKVRFLGETGAYTLYYNTYRKHMIVGVADPAYPDYLLVTGGGIGYPTKVDGIDKEHVWWGFSNVRNFILFRKIADDVFQGTMFIHAKDDSWVGFKPYETTGWGGEKAFSLFTVTGEDVLEGTSDGNWHPKENLDAGAFYRLTINWANNSVNVEKITL